MDKKTFLIFAITKFEEKALEVISSMCLHFDLDIKLKHPFEKLESRRADLWKGQFDNWKYRFHGDSCEFINIKNSQFLDIKINRDGYYGAIDLFFLFRFIDSTEGLKELDTFANNDDINEMYEQLKSEGIITNIGNEFFPTWILNKDAL